MKYFLALLVLLPSFVFADITSTGTVNLSWEAPTENTDGSPLTDLAGYKLYWGHDNNCTDFPNELDLNDPSAVNHQLNVTLTQTTSYCFNITAYNVKGQESDPSNSAEKTLTFNINYPPNPPVLQSIDMTFNCTTDVVGLTCSVTVE